MDICPYPRLTLPTGTYSAHARLCTCRQAGTQVCLCTLPHFVPGGQARGHAHVMQTVMQTVCHVALLTCVCTHVRVICWPLRVDVFLHRLTWLCVVKGTQPGRSGLRVQEAHLPLPSVCFPPRRSEGSVSRALCSGPGLDHRFPREGSAGRLSAT